MEASMSSCSCNSPLSFGEGSGVRSILNRASATPSLLERGQVVRLNYDLDQGMNNALKRWYERKKGTQPDTYLTYLNAQKLYTGVKEGMNEELKNNIPFASQEHRMLLNLKYNTAVTAVFKNHHNHEEVAKLMYDVNGKLRSFYEFKKAAMPTMDKYNKTWLETEYNTAKASAREAAKWAGYVKKGGKIQFNTIGDGRVRDAHRALNGTIYPIEHPFWDTHIPPLDWRCRCYTTHVPADEADQEPNGELPEIKEMFHNNPGKTMQVFDQNTPYFEVDAKNEKQAAKKWNMSLPLNKQEIERNIHNYQAFKNNPELKEISTNVDSGGFVFAHNKADKSDLTDNINAANILSKEKGIGVLIREHNNVGKNPELLLNNTVISDLKTPEANTTGGINNRFKSAEKQLITNLVLDMIHVTDRQIIIEGLIRGFRNNKSIKECWVIIKDKVAYITRKDFVEYKIPEIINEL